MQPAHIVPGYIIVPLHATQKQPRVLLNRSGISKKSNVLIAPKPYTSCNVPASHVPKTTLPSFEPGKLAVIKEVPAGLSGATFSNMYMRPISMTEGSKPNDKVNSPDAVSSESKTHSQKLCSVMKHLKSNSNWKRTLQYLASDEFKSFQSDLENGQIPNIDELVDKVMCRKRRRKRATDKNVNKEFMDKRNRAVNEYCLARQHQGSKQDVYDELNVDPRGLADIFSRKSACLNIPKKRLKSSSVSKAPLLRVVQIDAKPKEAIDSSQSGTCTASVSGSHSDTDAAGTIGTQTELESLNLWLDGDSRFSHSQTQTGFEQEWMRTLSTNFLSAEALHMGTQTPLDQNWSGNDLILETSCSNTATQTAVNTEPLLSSLDRTMDVKSAETEVQKDSDFYETDNIDFCVSRKEPMGSLMYATSASNAAGPRSRNAGSLMLNPFEEQTNDDFEGEDLPQFGDFGTQTTHQVFTEPNHSGTQTCNDLLKSLLDTDVEVNSSATQTLRYIDPFLDDSSKSHMETQTAFTFNDLLDPGFLGSFELEERSLNHMETQTLTAGLNSFADSGTQTGAPSNV